jgi:gamma-glutamyltranspeptidase/glutathione hydrolase/leukotriene-C4 hydrolase
LSKSIEDNKLEKTEYYHRLTEAFKHAYAHRALLGDDVEDREIQKVVEKLDDDAFLDSIRAKISDYTTYQPSFYSKKLFKEDRGTAHISILADGDAVSLTSSINT